MTQIRSVQIIATFSLKTVIVLGDVMLDRFVYGAVERISPEAPVPVLSVVQETAMPGGAANVARNIASLGGTAILIGAAGADTNGRILSDIIARNDRIQNELITVTGRPTTTKTRLVAENQQVVRVDSEVRTSLGQDEAALLAQYAAALPGADLVILSDYAKGVLSPHVLKQAIDMARAAGKPVVADPKSDDISRYDGASVITPNFGEAAKATGLQGRDNAAAEAMAGAILTAAPNLGAVVITRSADGMSLAERGKPVRHVPVAAKEVADVSGAGDTVVATLALALAAGADLAEAVDLSNTAAGIAVAKRGTAEVRAEELMAEYRQEEIGQMIAKNADLSEAQAQVKAWRDQGLRVGFTNGCFDLIHPGHVSLLAQARSNCDRLIVGLNTDESVRRLKGPTRPVQDERARAVVLGALASVDLVVLFGEETPKELIEKIRPDVLVKGADYRIDQVVGADFVQSYGGKVVLVNLTEGQSTTGIISRIDRQKV